MSIKQKVAANDNHHRALLLIRGYVNQGKTLYQIADDLNESGFQIAKGQLFQRTQVWRLMARL